MNEEQKNRYQLLKDKNVRNIKENNWKTDFLFQECIGFLNDCMILTLEDSENIFKMFEENFPITLSGSIKWDEFNGTIITEGISYVHNTLSLQNKYYVLWDKQDIPCIVCDLATILNHINDVLAVSFNTWLLSMDGKETIEFYHEGTITYGKLN